MNNFLLFCEKAFKKSMYEHLVFELEDMDKGTTVNFVNNRFDDRYTIEINKGGLIFWLFGNYYYGGELKENEEHSCEPSFSTSDNIVVIGNTNYKYYYVHNFLKTLMDLSGNSCSIVLTEEQEDEFFRILNSF